MEIAALTTSIIALVIGLLSFFIYKNDNRINMGHIEIEIFGIITNARINFEQSTEIILDLPDNNNNDKYQRIYHESLEKYLNAIEIACSQCLYKRVNGKYFKATYYNEIVSLVKNESDIISKKYNSVSTPYKSTIEVYKVWTKDTK